MTVFTERPRLVSVTRRVTQVVARGGQGDAGPPGPSGSSLTAANISASATAGSRTCNFIRANNVALTTPATPSHGDPLQVIVPQAYTGFSVVGDGATVDGGASADFPVTPCALTFVYDSTEDNWFIQSLYTGQNPA